jgi:beta-aspartyl-peptidase (threonine type)
MPSTPTILVHAGAGPLGSELREHGGEVTQALTRVLDRAGERLQAGQDAVAVATQAVQDMEDCEYFNAGYGAALCSDGSVELSASLMRGSDRAAGGVAGLRLIRNPIRAAAIVLESDQVLMIGQRADELALAQGAERWENSAFVTERQRGRLLASPTAKPEDRGTVGAVCLDSEGRLAAATSTGGITGQPPGRVGDSPLIGAGTWADERAAVSCTGAGEVFIRVGVGRWIAAMVSEGVGIEEAAERAMAEVGQLGGDGGLIALDKDGRASLPFSTQAMPRGIWRAGQAAEVRLA